MNGGIEFAMFFVLRILISLGVLCLTTSALLANPAIFLERGDRVALVCALDEGDAAKFAADDLGSYLTKALGANVEILSEPTEDRAAIYLGLRYAERFGVDPRKVALKPGGYLWKTRPNELLIAGADDAGTSNGVYGFLHEYVGARWFMPGELFEVVPKLNELSIPDLDRTVNPSFAFRIYSGVTTEAGAKWMARNRLDVSRVGIPYFGFGHNLANIFPPSIYGKTHPEYYAEIDGKRLVPPSDGAQVGQPCMTNPDVIEIAARAAIEFFDKKPNATTFSLCVNDDGDFCRCRNCRALDSPYRKSHGWTIFSDSYFHFVEKVAEKVYLKYPDKFLGCYAYWAVELPPRKIERLPDNVVIALTQETSQHYDRNYKKADRDLWQQWTKVAKHLAKYDYYGLGWITPRYFPTLAAEDIEWIGEHGAVGMYCEVYPYWSNVAPQLYLGTRLLWNFNEDPRAILEGFYQQLFGPGAPYIKKFYDQLEKCWTQPRTGRWFEGLDDMRAELKMVDIAGVERAMKCLSDAQQATIGVEQERVRYIQDRFAFTYLVSKTYSDAKTLKSAPLKREVDVAAIIGGVEEVLRGVAATEKVYETCIAADPLYQHTYYFGSRFKNKFATWHDEVRGAVQEALVRVREWTLTLDDPDDAKVIWEDLVARLAANPTAEKFELLKFLNPPVTCPKVETPLRWSSVPMLKIDPSTFDGRERRGDEDCLAEFRIAWDDEFFHFRCAVTDDVFLQQRSDALIWLQDSVQIAFDPLRNAWSGVKYGTDDYEYGFALTPNGPLTWRWCAAKGKKTGAVKNIQPQIIREGSVTTYEVAIPWSELEPLKPRAGAMFGFSVLVNDDDGSGRGWMEWAGGIARGKDPRRFVGVVLEAHGR